MHRKAHDQNPRGQIHVIWLGDFNSHHPMWDQNRNTHLFTRSNLDKAQTIIDMMARYNLQMILPKNILTLCTMVSRNYTQPDNVLASSSLHKHILECKTTLEEWPTKIDHIPIIMTLNMSPGRQEETPRPNFKAADWPKF